MIKLWFHTIDGIRKVKTFKTLKGARKAAHDWAGADSTVSGSGYAISSDGVVKVMCAGCTLAELFGEERKDGDEFFYFAGVNYKTFEAAKADREKMLDDGYGEFEGDGSTHIEAYRWDGSGYVAAPELIPAAPPRSISDDEIPF